MSAETPPTVYGPRLWYGAARPTPNVSQGSVQLTPHPVSAPAPPLPPFRFREEPTMKCVLCQNFAGPQEICCDCLRIAFPHCPPPEWLKLRTPSTEVRTPQPIS